MNGAIACLIGVVFLIGFSCFIVHVSGILYDPSRADLPKPPNAL